MSPLCLIFVVIRVFVTSRWCDKIDFSFIHRVEGREEGCRGFYLFLWWQERERVTECERKKLERMQIWKWFPSVIVQENTNGYRFSIGSCRLVSHLTAPLRLMQNNCCRLFTESFSQHLFKKKIQMAKLVWNIMCVPVWGGMGKSFFISAWSQRVFVFDSKLLWKAKQSKMFIFAWHDFKMLVIRELS